MENKKSFSDLMDAELDKGTNTIILGAAGLASAVGYRGKGNGLIASGLVGLGTMVVYTLGVAGVRAAIKRNKQNNEEA